MFKIIFYKKKDGKSPIDEFLDELRNINFKLYVKTEKMLELLEEKGNLLTEPYSKHICDGIYELRTIQGNNITRLFYFYSRNKIIVVNHGIIKKTKKTSKQDIQKALARKEDYERRFGNE